MRHTRFKKIGEKLFLRGLNNSHSGNISVREKDHIYITATGASLDELTEKDIIQVEITPHIEQDKKASMELLVHRAIYQADDRIGAVVHAHAPYAIAIAEGERVVIPSEQEGRYYFKQIPVLQVQNAIASSEVAIGIVRYVKETHAAIVMQHGVFAWGETLEKAYQFLMVVESACHINYLSEVLHATKNN